MGDMQGERKYKNGWHISGKRRVKYIGSPENFRSSGLYGFRVVNILQIKTKAIDGGNMIYKTEALALQAVLPAFAAHFAGISCGMV